MATETTIPIPCIDCGTTILVKAVRVKRRQHLRFLPRCVECLRARHAALAQTEGKYTASCNECWDVFALNAAQRRNRLGGSHSFRCPACLQSRRTAVEQPAGAKTPAEKVPPDTEIQRVKKILAPWRIANGIDPAAPVLWERPRNSGLHWNWTKRSGDSLAVEERS